MALITFQDLPNTTTPINANNLNNNFNECGADTGWQTLNTAIKYRKVGKIVYVVGNSSNVNVGNGDYTTVGTLPTNYKPSIMVHFVAHFKGGIHEGQSCYVDTDGTIKMYLPSGDSSTYWGFSVSFPL